MKETDYSDNEADHNPHPYPLSCPETADTGDNSILCVVCELGEDEDEEEEVCAHGATGGSMRAVCCQTISFRHKTLTFFDLTATDGLQDIGQMAKLVLNSFCAHSDYIIINFVHSYKCTHPHTVYFIQTQT